MSGCLTCRSCWHTQLTCSEMCCINNIRLPGFYPALNISAIFFFFFLNPQSWINEEHFPPLYEYRTPYVLRMSFMVEPVFREKPVSHPPHTCAAFLFAVQQHQGLKTLKWIPLPLLFQKKRLKSMSFHAALKSANHLQIHIKCINMMCLCRSWWTVPLKLP